jgi:glyoxylase-like metal-dependent hydrolase (beta-lactamase superfamily II)
MFPVGFEKSQAMPCICACHSDVGIPGDFEHDARTQWGGFHMSRSVVVASAAAFLLLGTVAHAQGQRDFSDVQTKTTPLGNGRYMLGGQGGTISGAVTAQGIIRLDGEFAPLAGKINASITAINPGKIRDRITTHHHGDHAGGNADFVKEGVTIISQENLRSRLAGTSLNNQGAAAAAAAEASPIVIFKDVMNIGLGGKSADVVHVPRSRTDGAPFIHFRNEFATGDILSSSGFTNIFRDRFRTSRDRVGKLFAAGQTEGEAIAAKPLADLEVTWKSDDANHEAFTRLVYWSIKTRS